MPRCKYCNKLNKPVDCFQDPDNASYQYCSEEHWKLYKESKSKKKISKPSTSFPISSPKTPTKKPVSDLRKLTDYIKSVWPIEPNWLWFNKQIKNLVSETGLTHNEMRLTIKYCIDYKGMQPDESYGLQQFIPRYSQEALEFGEDILRIKEQAKDLEEQEDPIYIVAPKPYRPTIKEDLEF